MLTGGVYTFQMLSSKNNNGYSVQYLPNNSANTVQNIANTLATPDVSKFDPLLSQWMTTGIQPANLNTYGGQTSILFFTKGDPTLNGMINPIGYFRLGTSGIYYVQTYVNGVNELNSIASNSNVIRVVADLSNKEPVIKGDLHSGGVNLTSTQAPASLPNSGNVAPQNFYARELMGANNSFVAPYDGTGVVINLHDTGVDLGHTALAGILATKNDGSSAAFDGTGLFKSVTNKYTGMYIKTNNASDPTANDYLNPLKPSANSIDISKIGDMKVWSAAAYDLYTMNLLFTGLTLDVPTSYNVAGIPGASQGYYFGLSLISTGRLVMLVPFLLYSSAGNSVYDSVIHDWDTGYKLTAVIANKMTPAQYKASVNYSFADDYSAGRVNNAQNPILHADWLDTNGNPKANGDGWYDLSLGALGNSVDVFDVNFNNNEHEIMSGIDPNGYGFAYMEDYDTHGTGTAGSIAAQDVQYRMYDNASDPNAGTYSIQGIAPNAKILPSIGLITQSADIWSYLWAAGFEPNSNGDWSTWSGDHVANMSSNSWGFLNFKFEANYAHGFDIYSLFMELLSTPNTLDNNPGLLFVISSGNEGNGYGGVGGPNPISGILVGASTDMFWRANASNDDPFSNMQGAYELSGFSTSGPSQDNYPKIDVVNFGAFDYSTAPTDPFYSADYSENTGSNNSYQLFGGTSQAAPYTAAALSYIFAAYKANNGGNGLSPDLAKVYLKSTATDLGYDAYRQGSGQVNITAAVDLVVNDNGNVVYGTDGTNNAASRYASAINYYFGQPDTYGTPGLPASYPAGTKDTTVAFGTLRTSDTPAAQSLTTVKSEAGATAYTFTETYSDTITGLKTNARYNYHSLATTNNWLSNIAGADFVQIVLTVDPAYFESAWKDELGFRIFIINDTNGGALMPRDRQVTTYGYNFYSSVSVTVSTRQLGPNSYIGIRDDMFTKDYTGDLTPGVDYTLSIRAFSRTVDPAVSVSTGPSTSWSVNVDPTGLAPGFYEGYIQFTSGILAEYTYSVAVEANNYATNGMTTITGLRNIPMDNKMLGVVDYIGFQPSGDWRYFDIYANNIDATTKALAVEVNWTYPGTVIDAYLLNYSGVIVADSNPQPSSSGKSDSYTTGPTVQRLVANITGYNTAPKGQYFTLVLHAVNVNTTQAPWDQFSVGVTWTTSNFANTGDFVGNNGVFLADGSPVTEKTAGISWNPASGGNPIARFTPVGAPTTLEISDFISIHDQQTVNSPKIDQGTTYTHTFFQKQLYLTQGMLVHITLGWNDASDIDMILVPSGQPLDVFTDLGHLHAATLNNPEVMEVKITETGYYTLAAVYYDGSQAPFTYTLDIDASISLFNTASNTTSSLSFDLPAKGVTEDSILLLTSTNTGGYNGGNSVRMPFSLNVAGPRVTPVSLNENLDAQVTIAKIFDSVPYSFTVTKSGTTVFDGKDLTKGEHDVVVDSSLIVGYNEPNTFEYTAKDQFGKESSGSFVVTRPDLTAPVFTSTPDDASGKTGKDITLTWTIQDVSGGDYKIYYSGVEQPDMAGTWTPGDLSITFKFAKSGDYYIKLEVIDAGLNSKTDQVKITVKKSSSGGFIPFDFTFFIIAIPILVALKKKKNL